MTRSLASLVSVLAMAAGAHAQTVNNRSLSNGGTLSPGSPRTISGSVSSSTGMRYAFSATAGTQYVFCFGENGGSSTYDPWLSILGPSGNLLAQNDDYHGLQSHIAFTPTTGGTYSVAVTGFSSSAGSYLLACWTSNPVSTSSPWIVNHRTLSDGGVLTPGSPRTVSGSVIPSNGVRYTFSAVAGTPYVFCFGENGGSSTYDPWLSILGPSGNVLAQNDDTHGLQSHIAFTPTAGGTYHVAVTGFSSSSGSFTLAYWTPETVRIMANRTAEAAPPTGFMKGVSYWEIPTAADVGPLRDLGAQFVRPHIRWRSVEPTIVNPGLTRAHVDSSVDASIAGYGQWSEADAMVTTLTQAGFQIVAVLGLGYDEILPRLYGAAANPDLLGRDRYLGCIYRYARAAVRRYRDRIRHWQIEGELNQAMFTSAFGWRSPRWSPLFPSNIAWGDRSFQDRLIQTLSAAVRAEDPGAVLYTQIHTDIHRNLLLDQRDWPEAIRDWAPHVDVIGLSAFPNYYVADPVYAGDLGDRVRIARQAAPGKRIILAETCSYAPAPNAALPDPVDFTEAKQAQFVRDGFRSAVAAGASGFFHFSLRTWGIPGGQWTSKDLDVFRTIGPAFRNGDQGTLFGFFWREQPYVNNRLATALQVVENGSGLVRGDWSYRPSFYALRDEFRSLSSFATTFVAGLNFVHVPLQPRPDYRLRDLLLDTGAAMIVSWYEPERRWVSIFATTPATAPINESARGDRAYFLQFASRRTHVFLGSPWIEFIQKSGASILPVGLPRSRAGYRASDLLRESGASQVIWWDRPAQQFRTYVSGGTDFAPRGDEGYLLVNAPAGGFAFPGSPW